MLRSQVVRNKKKEKRGVGYPVFSCCLLYTLNPDEFFFFFPLVPSSKTRRDFFFFKTRRKEGIIIIVQEGFFLFLFLLICKGSSLFTSSFSFTSYRSGPRSRVFLPARPSSFFFFLFFYPARRKRKGPRRVRPG